MQFLYQLTLFLFSLCYLPKVVYQRLFLNKYKHSLWQRFGKDFPEIRKGARKLIWVHAVSVGETKAVAALAKLLKNDPSNPILIVSSISETGHAEAKKSLPFADYHLYLPLDFYPIIAPIIKKVKPDLVVLTEGDFWYQFITECKKQGAHVVLVNGKLSARSLKRYLWFKPFAKALFSKIDRFCIQNPFYLSHFEKLGIDLKKCTVTGNMKFDEEYPKLNEQDLVKWRNELGIKNEDPVLVIGSTHDPEEKLVLDMLISLQKKFPNLKTLIVPRHPERFNQVANLIANYQIPFRRYSEKDANKDKNASVILVDAMGVLRKCYQLATLALVGGSFTSKVGGHNIIEPCWYGVPVLFGPHMHTQKELVSLVKQFQAGIQLEPAQLVDQFATLLQSPQNRKQLGDGGIKMVSQMQGATKRTFAEVHPFYAKKN